MSINVNELNYQPKSKEPTNYSRSDEPVKTIEGSAEVRPSSGLKRIASELFAGDMKSVERYIIHDVLVPYWKKAMMDIVVGAVETLLYDKRSPSHSGKTDYNSRYRTTSSSSTNEVKSTTLDNSLAHVVGGDAYKLGDIIVHNSWDAEEAIRDMVAHIRECDVVSVAYLKRKLKLKSEWTENKYGWTNADEMAKSRIERVDRGWLMILPPVEVL